MKNFEWFKTCKNKFLLFDMKMLTFCSILNYETTVKYDLFLIFENYIIVMKNLTLLTFLRYWNWMYLTESRNIQDFEKFCESTKHEIIQITNHNLLCSLDPSNQSWLFWLVGLLLAQSGLNVRIVRIFYFVTLKLYGFFFKLCGLYEFLSWKYIVFFLNFHSFQQIFHENFKKKFSSKWS